MAGARWAGKKVTFGEGGDGDSDEQEEEEDGSKAAKPAPSGPSGERGGSEKATGGGPGPKSPDKVKWKARRRPLRSRACPASALHFAELLTPSASPPSSAPPDTR